MAQLGLRGPITAPEADGCYRHNRYHSYGWGTMVQAADKDIWSADITDLK